MTEKKSQKSKPDPVELFSKALEKIPSLQGLPLKLRTSLFQTGLALLKRCQTEIELKMVESPQLYIVDATPQ